MNYSNRSELIDAFGHVAKWLAIAVAVALLAGTATAFFLFAMQWATDMRSTTICTVRSVTF